jgi:hypothetical protein
MEEKPFIPDQTRWDAYRAYTGPLHALRQSNFEKFDQAILTLSSGGLGLSIAFIKSFIPDLCGHICLLIILLLSWILFAGALLSTMMSFRSGKESIDEQLANAEKYYLEGRTEFLNRHNPFTVETARYNKISFGLFILAVILTLVFVSICLCIGGRQ